MNCKCQKYSFVDLQLSVYNNIPTLRSTNGKYWTGYSQICPQQPVMDRRQVVNLNNITKYCTDGCLEEWTANIGLTVQYWLLIFMYMNRRVCTIFKAQHHTEITSNHWPAWRSTWGPVLASFSKSSITLHCFCSLSRAYISRHFSGPNVPRFCKQQHTVYKWILPATSILFIIAIRQCNYLQFESFEVQSCLLHLYLWSR